MLRKNRLYQRKSPLPISFSTYLITIFLHIHPPTALLSSPFSLAIRRFELCPDRPEPVPEHFLLCSLAVLNLISLLAVFLVRIAILWIRCSHPRAYHFENSIYSLIYSISTTHKKQRAATYPSSCFFPSDTPFSFVGLISSLSCPTILLDPALSQW